MGHPRSWLGRPVKSRSVYSLLVPSEKVVEILLFHVMEIYGSVGAASTEDVLIHETLTQRGLLYA
jgi:hypothetical protein